MKLANKCKFVVVILFVFLAIPFSGCGKYNSDYTATAHVISNENATASLDFSTFTGTEVFKVKSGEDGNVLKCHSVLGEGSIKVYCDYDGVKRDFLEITSGGDFDEYLDIDTNSTVYIIVESEEESKDGNFEFEVCSMEHDSKEYKNCVIPYGSAEKLEGKIVLVTIFDVHDPKTHTRVEVKKDLLDEVLYSYEMSADYLKEELKKYGKDVELIWNLEKNSNLYFEEELQTKGMVGERGSEKYQLQFDSNVESFMRNNIDIADIKKKYDSANVVFLVFKDSDIHKEKWPLTTYANPTWCGGGSYEYAEIMFDKNYSPADVTHEMLHLFGAPDLYYKESYYSFTERFVNNLYKREYNDIMRDYRILDGKITAPITELSAYYLGLTDYSLLKTNWSLGDSEHETMMKERYKNIQ